MKPKRQEDQAYLKAIRGLECWACRMDGIPQESRTEAHHPKPGCGKGQKSDDRDSLPLCSRHHNEQHPDSLSIHRNPHAFRNKYGTESEIRDAVLKLLGLTE